MITGELKNKIDSLWDVFATGGLTNPLEVIEQITYLMFIHDLDELDNKKAKECAMLGLPFQSMFTDEVSIGDRNIDGQQLKWSVFHDFTAEKMKSEASGLRKTSPNSNSLAHRTTWLRSDFRQRRFLPPAKETVKS